MLDARMNDSSLSETARRTTAACMDGTASAVKNMKPMVPLDIDWNEDDEQEKPLSDRIVNWARVTTERGWRSATCLSIEGRYRPEGLTEEEDEKRRTPQWTPDVADAWEVEDAWKELPDVFRFCLQWTYLGRWKPRKIWQKLGPYRSLQVRMRNYDDALRLARFALRNQLRRRRARVPTSEMRPVELG